MTAKALMAVIGLVFLFAIFDGTESHHISDACSLSKRLKLTPTDIYKECNILIPKDDTQAPPVVFYPEAEANVHYILVMMDPDAGGRTWLHWLKTDITSQQLVDGVTGGGQDDKVEYRGPSPPSGTHRYQFFLFEQTSTGLSNEKDYKNRGSFCLDDFIKKNGLLDPDIGFQYRTKAE